VSAVAEQEATRRLATARLVPAGEEEHGVVVDALFASSGIEAEVVDEAQTLQVQPDCRIPVATIGHLIALKVLARDDVRRPMDRADLNSLLRVATPADVLRARAALALIESRGFQRGRHLEAELEQLMRESPS
jgi:hypothetical protein